ncbi:MAG TPA: hypothetical protein VGG10_09480 [Rhizomicrobium sp.]|jgi:DNA-binding CsgD family transcriptional regulator/PAS domain-containing protein
MQSALIDERLVSTLYETALFGGGWTAALERFRGLIKADEVALSFFDASDEYSSSETTGHFLSEEVRRQYQEHYIYLDPKRHLFARRPVGFLFNDTAHFDDAFVAHDPFYQEFSRPLGSRHTLDLLLDRDSTGGTYFAAMRNKTQGAFDDRAEAGLRQVARHIAIVLGLKRKVEAAESAVRSANAAFDRLNFGVIVLDGTGRAKIANRAALEAAGEGGALRLRGGHLSARAAESDKALDAMLRGAIASSTLPAQVLHLSRADGGSLVLWVMPLPRAHPLAEDGRALVLVGNPAAPVQMHAPDLMALFDLSLAEAELALALMHGQTLNEAAAHRGVKSATTRTQLLSILQKTGLHRQTDLVRMLTALPGTRIR